VIAEGVIEVRHVAPSLFSLDASGQGPGSILNAVTYRLEPFDVVTPEIPGADQRTRLALYGTGIRWAGNPGRSALYANAAIAVRVEMLDAPGQRWDLPVEYAGPAPGFAGLDQVNVVVPAGAEGAGVVTLSLTAESAPSNVVTAVIRSSQTLSIDVVGPVSAPPGAWIDVHGGRFGVVPDGAPSRTVVTVDAGGVESRGQATTFGRSPDKVRAI
jgi:hypothetical protein